MSKKKNLHLIIHAFDAPEDSLIRRSFVTFVKKRKKEFTKYFQSEENDLKADIEKRIHIDATNIFDGLKDLVNSAANVKEKELVTA